MQILTASWIVPVDGPPIRDGRVAVRDHRIVWLGAPGDAGEPEGTEVRLGTGVLLPGLVNAHCHLELSWLKGRLPLPSAFVPWVAALVEARAGETAAEAREAVQTAIRGLEERGTVAVGDVSNALGHLDLLAASGLDAVVFYELLGWNPAMAADILNRADEQMARVGARPSANVQIRLAAHAPHSVSAALVEGLKARGAVGALHLAESRDETRFLADGDGPWSQFLKQRVGDVAFRTPRLSPVRYVSGLGILHPRLVAAHCVQVDAADRRILARAGVHVAICPRSNRNLGVGVAPVPELLADGVRLCLGTDSLASVPTLDLLDDAAELRWQFPALESKILVHMATAGGAQALGFSDLGTIAPGKRAALAFVPTEERTRDPLGFLVSGEARSRSVAL